MAFGRARYGFLSVLAIVLLRLVVGWHFFSEGREKLAYDAESGEYHVTFTAEGFLRGAKGPLAESLQAFVPSDHNWQALLSQPAERREAADEEAAKKRDDAITDWIFQRNAAAKSANPPDIETPDFAPYKAWENRILADWVESLHTAIVSIPVEPETHAAATETFEARKRQLKDYLAGEFDAIADYQHELWRVEQQRQDPKTGELPFHDERIAQLEAESRSTARPWIAQVASFQDGFRKELQSLLITGGGSNAIEREAISRSFEDPAAGKLRTVNMVITALTLGVGICLLLGLFTRLASIAGIGFLLSVMASQPPWVAGAETDFFFYQLVECAALLVLFATAAGRWLGLDYFPYAIWDWVLGRGDND